MLFGQHLVVHGWELGSAWMQPLPAQPLVCAPASSRAACAVAYPPPCWLLLRCPPAAAAAGQVGDCHRGVGASWNVPIHSGCQARNTVARQKFSQYSRPTLEALLGSTVCGEHQKPHPYSSHPVAAAASRPAQDPPLRACWSACCRQLDAPVQSPCCEAAGTGVLLSSAGIAETDSSRP